MRIAIVARSKRHTRIYYYFKKAFERLGHQTLWIKYSRWKSLLGERLATVLVGKFLFGYKPDMLFFHGQDVPYEILVRAKGRMSTVMYFDDCIKACSPKLDEVIRYGQQADVMYITCRGETSQYREWGVNAQFITGGCDRSAHYMVNRASRFYQSDIAFIGKPNTLERVEFMRELSQKFKLKLWGSGWEEYGLAAAAKDVYASEYRKICAGAKIILGWHFDPTVELCFSNRTWYTLGCGGFLLTLYSPGMEELFRRGEELDWFASPDECRQKIDYYLHHDEERRRIAHGGYELAHTHYSYEKMVEKILHGLSCGNQHW